MANAPKTARTRRVARMGSCQRTSSLRIGWSIRGCPWRDESVRRPQAAADSTSAVRKQISGALASAESLDIRHAGCVLALEAQHDGCRVSSGNLFCDRPKTSVGCCQRPFLIHRNTDEKAALVVGICLLTTNELDARMRKRTSAFVNDLTRTLYPWAWRLEGNTFAVMRVTAPRQYWPRYHE